MINTSGTLLLIIAAAALVLQWVYTLLATSARQQGRFTRTIVTASLFSSPRKGSSPTTEETRSPFHRIIGSLAKPANAIRQMGAYGGDMDRLAGYARIAAFVYAGAVLAAFALLLIGFITMDLTNRTVGLHASYDMDWPFRITIGLLLSSPGKILFLAALLSVLKLFLFNQEVGRSRLPGLALFGFIETIFLLGLVATETMQPFREFPMPLKMGQMPGDIFLHWTRMLESPLYLASIALFYLAFVLRFTRKTDHTTEEHEQSALLGAALLSLSALSMRLIWNFFSLPGGDLWVWSGDATMKLSWLLLLVSLFPAIRLSPTVLGKSLTGNLVYAITFTISFIAVWADLFRRGYPQEAKYAGLFLSIMAIPALLVSLHLAFRRVNRKTIRQQSAYSLSPKEGTPLLVMILAHVTPLLAFVLIAIAIQGLLPSDCITGQSGVETCEVTDLPSSVLNYTLTPVLLLLFGAGALALLGNRLREYKWLLVRSTIIGAVAAIALLVAGKWILPPVVMEDTGTMSSFMESAIVAIGVFLVVTAINIAWSILSGSAKDRPGSSQPSTGDHKGHSTGSRVGFPAATESFVQGALLGYTGAGIVLIGLLAGIAQTTVLKNFHYYLMMVNPEQDAVQYYSGDKAYLSDIQVESGSLYIGPRVAESAYRSNRLKFNVSYEGHYRITQGEAPRLVEEVPEGTTPRAFENRPLSIEDRLLHELVGVAPMGKVTTEIIHTPRVDPGKAEIIRGGPFGTALRDTSYRHDLTGFLSGDVYIQLEKLSDPESGRIPDLSHVYEYYYFDAGKNPQAYYNFFPHSLVATVRITVLSLVRLVWLGVLLILSGMILHIYGEIVRSGLFSVSFENNRENS